MRATLGLSALLLGQLIGCKQDTLSPQAQLDAIDASFAQARQNLELAKWNEAIDAEAPDLTQREETLAAHLRDPAIDARLAPLAHDRDPELSSRAQAWIAFRRAGAVVWRTISRWPRPGPRAPEGSIVPCRSSGADERAAAMDLHVPVTARDHVRGAPHGRVSRSAATSMPPSFVLYKRGANWQIVHFHRSLLPAT